MLNRIKKDWNWFYHSPGCADFINMLLVTFSAAAAFWIVYGLLTLKGVL